MLRRTIAQSALPDSPKTPDPGEIYGLAAILLKTMNPNQSELNRIRWQCRRGMLELDLLLGEFFAQVYPELDDQGKQDFIRLLKFPDPLLQRWLLGDGQELAAEMEEIVQMIRQRGQRIGDSR
jgi:antitoxin CptB